VQGGDQGIRELLDFPGRDLSPLGDVDGVEGEQIDDGDARAFYGRDDVGIRREVEVWQDRQEIAHGEGRRRRRRRMCMVWSDTASSSFPRTRVVYFKAMMVVVVVVVTRDVNARDIYAGRFLLVCPALYCCCSHSSRRGEEVGC
jgi:hypothetical protein